MSSSNLLIDTHSNMEECISNVAVLFEVTELYRVVEPEDLVGFLQNGSNDWNTWICLQSSSVMNLIQITRYLKNHFLTILQ